MTRKQIGEALQYKNPDDSIYRIHERNKDRLDRFSVTDKLSSTDGKQYETILYRARGIYDVIRFSRQPLADEFMDWVYDAIGTQQNKRINIYKPTNLYGRWACLLPSSIVRAAIMRLIVYIIHHGSKCFIYGYASIYS